MSPQALLSVKDLRVGFATEGGRLQAVDGVSFDLSPGEVLAIVGESGSGKSVTAQTILGLTRSHNSVIEGSVRLRGAELLDAGEAELRKVRGAQIAMIFQDPMTSLNPVYRVGAQIVEAIRAHESGTSREDAAQAGDRAARLGRHPRRGAAGRRLPARVLRRDAAAGDDRDGAGAGAGGADRRRADHGARRHRPGADPAPAAKSSTASANLATILITHDLGVVAEVADRVLVMYAGKVVEEGTLDEIFYDPQHPYTWGLLGSLTRLDRPRPRRLPQISGAPPSLLSPPGGCAFRPRCPHEFGKCTEVPGLDARLPEAAEHRDRCWLTPEQKRERRQVEGRIGLEAPS